MRKVESRQQGPPAKRYWRRIVGWLDDWMYEKENTNIIRWLSFSFFGRKWMSIFVFGRKWNFIFVGIFVYGRKWKMLFGRPLVYATKRSWSWPLKAPGSTFEGRLISIVTMAPISGRATSPLLQRPSKFPIYPMHRKTRMIGLPESSKGFTVGLATYTHYRRPDVNVSSGIVSGVTCVKSNLSL